MSHLRWCGRYIAWFDGATPLPLPSALPLAPPSNPPHAPQDLASDFTDLATCIKDDPQADVEPLSAYEIQAKPESDGRRRSGSVITKRDFRQYPPLSPPSGPLLPQRPRPQAAATSLRKAKGPEEVVRDDTAFALENFEMPHDEEACSELSSRPSSVGVPGGQGAA